MNKHLPIKSPSQNIVENIQPIDVTHKWIRENQNRFHQKKYNNIVNEKLSLKKGCKPLLASFWKNNKIQLIFKVQKSKTKNAYRSLILKI